MLRVGQLLEHVFVAGALGRIAGAALLRQHAELDAPARAGSRTASAATSGSRPRTTPAQPSQTSTSCFAGSKVSSAGRRRRTSGAGRSRGPRCCCGARGCCTCAPRYSGASPFDTSPRRAPIRIGRCSMPTGHWFSQAPQVVHCHSTFSRVDLAELAISRSPASSASCVCRMIVFGFSSLPAPHAGQFTWQRPHSTQVNASSTLLLPRSFTVSRPTCSFSKSRFGRLPSSGDFRNTVIGDSTRWKCFDAGISARNARITSACTHQFTRPASVRLVEPERQQEGDHQRGDEQRDDDRFDRHVRRRARPAARTRGGSAGRRCRTSTATANGVSASR